MAIKSITQLKTDLAATFTDAGLATASEYRSFITDVLDSVGSGTRLFPFVMDVNITEGDNAINHALNITVYQVIITDGTARYYPDFTATDVNNLTISWVGADLSTPTIQFLASV